MKMYRILYGSDFHGSEAYFRKFLAAALQYKANALIVGGDVTGKAMVPVIHQGSGRYVGYLFGRKEEACTPDELEKLKKTISNVGFYPIVIEQDEANDYDAHPDHLSQRFEQEMAQRIGEWLVLAQEKLAPQKIQLYFMAGNDDLCSMDDVIARYPYTKNPDGRILPLFDGEYQIVGLSYANMTPWKCARDVEEVELKARLHMLEKLITKPERTVAVLHVPPYDSGLDTCPELDQDLKIVTQGGQVLMKAAGSTEVREWIQLVQPLLSLHGHIHESAGHTRIGRTVSINAGSEYAEGIMRAAIINLEGDKVKGHMLISG